jgi:ribosomal-protein-alanine N-acetyltransferase
VTTIRLVPFADEHIPALHETMLDPEVLRFTRTPDPMPDGWIHEYVGRFDGEHRGGFAIMEGDQFVGYAVTGPLDREASEVELGYAVSPWGRGRGVATATLRELTQWAFDQGMKRVTALISVDNPASSRVAAKAGYIYEGVLRSMHHIGELREDLESWSILPGELPPS